MHYYGKNACSRISNLSASFFSAACNRVLCLDNSALVSVTCLLKMSDFIYIWTTTLANWWVDVWLVLMKWVDSSWRHSVQIENKTKKYTFGWKNVSLLTSTAGSCLEVMANIGKSFLQTVDDALLLGHSLLGQAGLLQGQAQLHSTGLSRVARTVSSDVCSQWLHALTVFESPFNSDVCSR